MNPKGNQEFKLRASQRRNLSKFFRISFLLFFVLIFTYILYKLTN